MIKFGVDFFLVSCSFQAIFIAYVLLVKSNVNSIRQNISLAIFIQLFSFAVLKGWYLGSEYYLEQPFFLFFPISITIGLGPSFYIYVRFLLQKNYRFKGAQLFHLLPIILQFSYFLWAFLMPEQQRVLYFKNEYFNTILLIEESFNFIAFCTYLVLAHKIYHKYRQSLPDNYSDISKLLFKSVGISLIGMYCLQFCWLGLTVVDFFFYDYALSYTAYYPIYTIIIVVIYFITYHGLFDTSLVPSNFVFDTTESSKFLPSNMIKSYLIKLNKAMDDKELFLREKLSLHELAEEIDANPTYLSQVINTELNKNFRDFVNGYRIEKAMRDLVLAKSDGTYISQIIHNCGFSSKSCFYDAFKKHTSKTPSQFIKEID